jgi:hypothetical protein
MFMVWLLACDHRYIALNRLSRLACIKELRLKDISGEMGVGLMRLNESVATHQPAKWGQLRK